EMRKQFAHRLEVLLDRAAALAANGVLEQRIHGDGGAHVVAVFVIAPAAARLADQLGLATGILAPRYIQAGALDAVLRAQGLAAADQRRLDLAARDLFGKRVDQILG